MAAILKVWRQIESPIPSINAYLLEEQSCQISSRTDLKWRNQAFIPSPTACQLQGSAKRYIGPLARVADQPGRRTLRSASSSSLLVPLVRLSTVASRVFTVAGPRVWNTLPQETTSAPSLTIFCQRLKTSLFRHSYPDLIIWPALTVVYNSCLTLK